MRPRHRSTMFGWKSKGEFDLFSLRLIFARKEAPDAFRLAPPRRSVRFEKCGFFSDLDREAKVSFPYATPVSTVPASTIGDWL